MIIRVILATENDDQRRELKRAVSGPGVVTVGVSGRQRLWRQVSREPGDLILVSRSMVEDRSRLETLCQLPEEPSVVVLSDRSDAREEADFLAAGCEAVLPSYLPCDAIRDALAPILRRRTREVEDRLRADWLVGAEPRLSDFVSQSRSMRAFMSVVNRVVPSDVSLLILGETGVGKERLARAIHAEGPRSGGPFVPVNCGALPESLMESELFGHERGAFTGAVRDRRGLFEMAHNGTVFLDEVAELQPHLQVKLLRVLQDHEIQRVGSEKAIKVDVRIMAATNRPIIEDVAEGRFRKDLFYRLGVVTLTVPALSERTQDILPLADRYVRHFAQRIDSRITGIDDEARGALLAYPWPGNVRELVNVIERAVILCDGDVIGTGDLPDTVRQHAPHAAHVPGTTQCVMSSLVTEHAGKPLRQARQAVARAFERKYLENLLHQTDGRVGETAKRAGLGPRALYEKMKACGLRKEDFR